MLSVLFNLANAAVAVSYWTCPECNRQWLSLLSAEAATAVFVAVSVAVTVHGQEQVLLCLDIP